jgi:FkbM family methyltransferase
MAILLQTTKELPNSTNGHGRFSFSQYDEEQFLLEYFDGREGVFWDIGAGDGIHDSNTRALFLKGWKGLCVEPVPEVFWRLEDGYRHSSGMTLINAAVAERSGYGPMWIVRDSGAPLKDNRHTLDAGFAAEVQAEEAEKYIVREVRLVSVKDLIKRCPSEWIDFLSVDAEGMDADIVRWVLTEGLRPQLIMFEADKGPAYLASLQGDLTRHGYAKVFENHVNQAWACQNREL